MGDQRHARGPRRNAVRLAVVLVGTLTALLGLLPAGSAAPARAALPAGPALDTDFPDPTVLTAPDGFYYAYSTQVGAVNVPVYRSADLVTWTALGDALPRLPAWASPGRTWAPSVIERAGRFLLYYTSHQRSADRQCISVAVADTPAGPFRDASPRDPADPSSTRPLICQYDLGGSIDPNAFADSDGSLYLLFKSDGTAIGQPSALWGSRLRPDGLAPAGHPPRFTRLLRADQSWEAGIIEGPAMVGHRGAYHLVFGGNWFESAYEALGRAVCTSPLGPCTATAGPWISAVPDYGGTGQQVGPGGAMFFRDWSGRVFMAYAAWTTPRVGYLIGGQRRGFLAPVAVGDGAIGVGPAGTGVTPR